ncbi:MAG: hypothetical protein GY782_10520 [Gammaproteobacteria bacterium]|nr:hypothetical protein [Gammaproteobacteria bacterium]
MTVTYNSPRDLGDSHSVPAGAGVNPPAPKSKVQGGAGVKSPAPKSKVQAVNDGGKTPDTGRLVKPTGGAKPPANGSQDLSRQGGKKGGSAKPTTSILKTPTVTLDNTDTDDSVIVESVVSKSTTAKGRNSRKRSRSRSKGPGNPIQKDRTEVLISSVQQLVKALNSNTKSKDRSRSASRQNNGVQRGRGKSQNTAHQPSRHHKLLHRARLKAAVHTNPSIKHKMQI